ncbi:hypothetical protein BpHYR1_027956 [Brachionus plicatilis]|uniref:Uncharacterized protein n=1 Tax=Brachionus plicatilis TaxID=10195 RepID=A0A3M7Q4L3_BRAPC|nr:hypothetical protein BpHYR1_027956 [Brachionus plicatilis]
MAIRKRQQMKTFIILLIIFSCLFLIQISNRPKRALTKSFIFEKSFEPGTFDEFILHSNCECQREVVNIGRKESYYKIKVQNFAESVYFSYNISKDAFESLALTCNLYSVLRKGPHQNVISYSLDHLIDPAKEVFLEKLADRLQFMKINYKNWRMRIYHDNSIDKSLICQKQCMDDTNGDLFDNVDFCDVTQMPVSLFNKWRADYVHPDLWKWFALGDDFVDRVAIRNKKSCLISRETAAVDEWIKSRKIFHIMRDHPSQDKEVIDGQWGVFTWLDRNVSRYLFSVSTDQRILDSYTPNMDFSDSMLKDYLWPLTKNKSTFSHDSYYCEKYKSISFPTKRESNCYIGSELCCSYSPKPQTNLAQICPSECRPVNYEDDWIYC